MKRTLLFTSIALFIAWIVGFFILDFPAVIHTVLWVSLLLLLRSFFVVKLNNGTALPN